REGVRVALREGDEIRQTHLGAEALTGPLAVAARLVAEQGVHQVAGAMLDAVHLALLVHERAALRRVGGAAGERLTAGDDAPARPGFLRLPAAAGGPPQPCVP